MPQGWDLKTFGTLIVAMYAALVSTYAALIATYMALQKQRDNRAEVKVTLNMGMHLPPGATKGVTNVNMGVANPGFRDVTFNSTYSVGLQFKGAKGTVHFKHPLADATFPRTLKHGEAFSVLAEYSDFKAAAAEAVPNVSRGKVRAVAQDVLDRKFYSRWVQYEL